MRTGLSTFVLAEELELAAMQEEEPMGRMVKLLKGLAKRTFWAAVLVASDLLVLISRLVSIAHSI